MARLAVPASSSLPAGNNLPAPADLASSLSKARKSFDQWIAKVDGQRQLLATWQAFVPQFHARQVNELEPLRQRADELRSTLLRQLDHAHDHADLNRRERARLAGLISHMAAELLTRSDDPALVALHDRHSELSHEDVSREAAGYYQGLARDVFGIDPADAETLRSADDLMDALAHGAGASRPARSSEAHRQARTQARTVAATRSVREVYRRLASALHPDRETDPDERARKTTLMQQVNRAHDQGDLLALLSLQREAERVDAMKVSTMGDAGLKHYNRVLKQQSLQLEQAIDELVEPFINLLPGRKARVVSPATVQESMNAALAGWRREVVHLRAEVAALQDARYLKAWLKHQEVPVAPRREDDIEAWLAMAARRR